MKLLDYKRLRERGIPYTRVHLARLIKADKFPAPVSLSTKRIAWVEAEIDDWIAKLADQRTHRATATAN